MNLPEFVVPKNKDSIVTFLNIFYTTRNYIDYIDTSFLYVKSAYVYIAVLHSE